MSPDGEPRPVIGLDLGTTNSCVSFVDPLGDLRRVAVATGNNPPYDRVLASIVLDPLGDERLIGLKAEQAREKRTDETYLAYFKHELDSQRLRERRAITRTVKTGDYDFVEQGERYEEVTEWVEVGGDFSRDELVAAAGLILEQLIQQAVKAGADPDSVLLVGVPVHFSGYARKRFVCALERVRDESGDPFFDGFHDVIERVRFILEPVAVAAAPGEDLDITGAENVLIFDYGGGTLDLSLVRYEERRGFPRPVPVRELAAGGSSVVAGRHMDAEFMTLLESDPRVRASLDQITDDVTRRQVVEEAKRRLSTSTEARIRIADEKVGRATFEEAIAPLLDGVKEEVLRTLERADLGPDDLGWVVMTGGSSLIPVVQESIMGLFPDLAERGGILRYFPDDQEGVEKAITDVAEGLAEVGQQDHFEHVVLWDVELGREGSGDFTLLFERGTTYEIADGHHQLETTIEVTDAGSDGCCLGIYENQLDRRFVFGLADVPGLEQGSQLRLRLGRDSMLPVLAVLDCDGRVVGRTESPTGWETDIHVAADVSQHPPPQLEDFFHQDAEYVPTVRHDRFRHAPLVRRLRVGDSVEWSRRMIGGELAHTRGLGRIERIRPIGEDEPVEEMTSWDVARFEFTIKTKLGELKLESRNGFLRLAPHSRFGGPM